MNPRGMYYGITIVVSFHPLFLTKVDQAFHVKCFFEEANRGVTAELGVSMIPTTEASATHGIPGCSYSMHSAGITDLDAGGNPGPPTKFARIGDKILHRWDCADPMFGVLIKNCYVTDGLGQRAEVIDDKGCPIDPILISGIRYASNLTVAYAESHVFKFADRPAVWFFCQIQMCMKDAQLCEGITPPSCQGTRPVPGYTSAGTNSGAGGGGSAENRGGYQHKDDPFRSSFGKKKDAPWIDSAEAKEEELTVSGGKGEESDEYYDEDYEDMDPVTIAYRREKNDIEGVAVKPDTTPKKRRKTTKKVTVFGKGPPSSNYITT